MKVELALAVLTASTVCLRASAPAAIETADLEAFLSPWIEQAMRESSIPGAAVSVIQGGKILYEKGYGWADIETHVPVDARTVFRVGSVSKSVSATAVLAALEARGLTATTAAEPLLKGLPLRPPMESPLTFHHLLTHTAGFNEHLFGQHVPYRRQFKPLIDFLREELPPRFIEPGQLIAYVDYHTCLAGAAAAKLDETNFEELAETRVFQPLSMNRSTFRQVNLPGEIEAALAKSYTGAEESVPMKRDYVLSTPAAGLFTTAHDMALYLLALDQEMTQVMSPESWRQQKRVQFSNHPRVIGRSFGFVSRQLNGHEVIYKDGQASGFSARIMLLPELGVGWFSVHNRNILGQMGAINSAGAFHRKLGSALLDRFFPPADASAEEIVPPSPPDDFAARRHLYLGTYRNVTASRHTWEKLISMSDEIRVEADEADRLRLAGGLFTEVEPGLLQWHQGHPFYVAFRFEGTGPASHLFYGTGAYERIPWYSTSRWTGRLLAGSTLILVLWSLVSGFQLLRGSADRSSRAVHRCGVLLAGANLLFLVIAGATLASTETYTLFWGAPLTLKLALALPLLALLPLLLLAWRVVSGWRAGRPSLLIRLWATLQVAAGIVFAWILHHWNLLAWRL